MKDLTAGKISKNLFFYSIPIVFTIILSRTHSTIDKIMIGQFIGENGLAAIGSTSSFITVVSSLFWSFGTGISLFIASNLRSSYPNDVARQIKSGGVLVMAFSAIISLIVIILQKPIFSLLYVGQEIYDDARIYYTILLMGQALLAFNCYAKEVFYYLGKPSYAFRFSLIDCVGNVVLNFIFLKVFNLGVLGAVVATVTVMFISAIFNACFLRKEYKKIYAEKVSVKISKQEFFLIAKLAIPCILQQGVLYLAGALVQPTVNRLGTSYVAAYSVNNEIYNVCTIFFYGSSKAIAVFCMQCVDKKISTLLKGIFVGIRQGKKFQIGRAHV